MLVQPVRLLPVAPPPRRKASPSSPSPPSRSSATRIPEQRGRGAIHDLLPKGMAILQAAGIREAYAEIDLQKAGMLRAFGRAG